MRKQRTAQFKEHTAKFTAKWTFTRVISNVLPAGEKLLNTINQETLIKNLHQMRLPGKTFLALFARERLHIAVRAIVVLAFSAGMSLKNVNEI